MGCVLNTIFADRLQADPRYKALVREVKDPLKAIGALYFVWSGTQAMRLLVATEDQLLDCFPLAYRGASSLISCLLKSGWLELTENGYRIIGNAEHVAKSEELSERNRQRAMKRWAQENPDRPMPAAYRPHAVGMNGASGAAARSDPIRSDPMQESARARPQGEDTTIPNGDRLLDYQAMTVPVSIAKAVRDSWADELLKKRNLQMPLMPTPKELEAFKQVVLMAGNQANAEMIARAFVHCEDPKGYFKRVGWAPWLLAEERNFAEARAKAATMMTKRPAAAI